MMTINEMIAVLQAAKEGKEIQGRCIGTSYWYKAVPNWSFDTTEYQVKPEPVPRKAVEGWVHRMNLLQEPTLGGPPVPINPDDSSYIFVREVPPFSYWAGRRFPSRGI